MEMAIKSAAVGARCYPGERAALLAVARKEGRAASDILRELVRDKARELGLWPMVLTEDRAMGGEREQAQNGTAT